MRYITLAMTLLLLMVGLAQAEEETFLNAQVTHGGYGALVTKYTHINDKFGFIVGAQGQWLINHKLGLGLGGYAVANEQDNIPVAGYEDRFNRRPHPGIAYGGVLLSYIHNSDAMIHPTFDLLIGGGSVSLNWNDTWHERYDNGYDYEEDNHEYDMFFVVEPNINVELNVIRFMRINAGISYRYVDGIEKYGYSNSDYAGLSGNLSFKFGKF